MDNYIEKILKTEDNQEIHTKTNSTMVTRPNDTTVEESLDAYLPHPQNVEDIPPTLPYGKINIAPSGKLYIGKKDGSVAVGGGSGGGGTDIPKEILNEMLVGVIDESGAPIAIPDDFPKKLPANGGNADTVGGYAVEKLITVDNITEQSVANSKEADVAVELKDIPNNSLITVDNIKKQTVEHANSAANSDKLGNLPASEYINVNNIDEQSVKHAETAGSADKVGKYTPSQLIRSDNIAEQSVKFAASAGKLMNNVTKEEISYKIGKKLRLCYPASGTYNPNDGYWYAVTLVDSAKANITRYKNYDSYNTDINKMQIIEKFVIPYTTNMFFNGRVYCLHFYLNYMVCLYGFSSNEEFYALVINLSNMTLVNIYFGSTISARVCFHNELMISCNGGRVINFLTGVNLTKEIYNTKNSFPKGWVIGFNNDTFYQCDYNQLYLYNMAHDLINQTPTQYLRSCLIYFNNINYLVKIITSQTPENISILRLSDNKQFNVDILCYCIEFIYNNYIMYHTTTGTYILLDIITMQVIKIAYAKMFAFVDDTIVTERYTLNLKTHTYDHICSEELLQITTAANTKYNTQIACNMYDGALYFSTLSNDNITWLDTNTSGLVSINSNIVETVCKLEQVIVL